MPLYSKTSKTALLSQTQVTSLLSTPVLTSASPEPNPLSTHLPSSSTHSIVLFVRNGA